MQISTSKIGLLVVLAVFSFLVAAADGKTIYVNKIATGAKNGTSWANAYTDLNTAINAASSGDQVWIAAGTYRPNDADPSNLARNQTFQLKNKVAVYGGFAGTESGLSQRALGINPVILSGDLKGNDSARNLLGQQSSKDTTTDNAYHVFFHPSSLALDSSAVLDSVTIRGGNANGGNAIGAAMYNISCSPTITNCTFTDNFATGSGAALYNDNSSPTISNCTIAYNFTYYGFPVHNVASSPKIINCTIANNRATYNGSGIYVTSGTVTLINSIVWGNQPLDTQIVGPAVIASNCIVQGGAPGENITTADPRLSPLDYYGGSTPTMPPSNTSPAVNNGLDSFAIDNASVAIPTNDQRGLSRVEAPDIGACEYQSQGYVSPIYFREGYQPCSIGSTPSLTFYTEGCIPTHIQWSEEPLGSSASPIAGGTNQSLTVPPLTKTTSFWVHMYPSNGSAVGRALTVKAVDPTVIYVSTAGDDAADGRSWGHAKRSLSAALRCAQPSEAYPGTQIWLVSGVYRPNDEYPSDLNLGQSFQLKNGVTVYGGFSGTETSAAQRDPVNNPVILSADLLGNDSAANVFGRQSSAESMSDNAYHVFFHPASLALDSSAILDSVTIRGGNAITTSPDNRGSAISNECCSPALANCTITDNIGTVMLNLRSSAMLTNCTIAYNHSFDRYLIDTQQDSSVSFTNCTIANNPTNFSGCVISLLASTAQLTGCTIVSNTASWPDMQAISVSDGSATLINCILWGQSYQISGGAVTASNCIIQGGYSGAYLFNSDPCLSPLGYHGGFTATMIPAITSPAINHGKVSVDVPETDQRGLRRDDYPDIGACEYQAKGYVSPVLFRVGYNPCTLGSSPSLSFYSEGLSMQSIQWFSGNTGDISIPIEGGTSQILTLSPLTRTTAVRARIDSDMGSFDTPSLTIQAVPPNIVYVATTGRDTNDGLTWTTAKRSVTSAMEAAIPSTAYPGAQVWIAAGIYHPNDEHPSNLDRNQAFQLKNGVSVVGGFSGTETSLAQRNPAGNSVILSGDLLGNDSCPTGLAASDPATTADNAYRVFNHPASLALTESAKLDSVTITGGNATDSSMPFVGAAITDDGCSPSITNCTISHNAASSGGGAIYGNGSTHSFANCTIAHNTGSAILNDGMPGGSATFTHCTIANNDAPVGSVLNSMGGSNVQTAFLNCILQGNGTADPSPIFWSPEFLNVEYCISPSSALWMPVSGTTNIVADPNLLPLGNYGGPTPTMPLPSWSAAINAGLASAQIPACDQRGIPRDVQPDIGAYEYPVYVGTDLSGGNAAIGASVTLTASTALPGANYQWYHGPVGDTSAPIATATGRTHTVPSMEIGSDFWVAITSGGTTVNSPTRSISVRGTFQQWAAFHGLSEEEADPAAAPANDGICNLVKYATGLRPQDSGSQADYFSTSVDSTTNTINLDLALSTTPTDVTWSFLQSSDLANWSEITGTATLIESATGTKKWRLSVPANQGNRFFRIQFQKGL